jgi:heptosyltransferase-1
MQSGPRNLPESCRILVVKLTSFGDVVHVTPCLKAIRRSFPRAEIVMAVDARFAPVIRCNPNVNSIVESRTACLGLYQLPFGILRELRPFRGKRFDVAIDFQGTRRSAAWVYASRSRFKAGRGGVRPGWDLVLKPNLSKHAVLVCADVARAIGIQVDDLQPEIYLSDRDDRELLSVLEAHGLPWDGFVIINPFSRWDSKMWPLERYAEVVSALRRDFGLPIVITGGPGEEQKAQECMSLLPVGAAVCLAGKLTLGQALCLYRRARLMVTGDSGPMHAAAALGTRTVSLFGPTLPERTGPWGHGHIVLQMSRPRSHHTYRADPERKHIRAIDVATVIAAIKSSLESAGSESAAREELTGGFVNPNVGAPVKTGGK